MIMAYHKNKQSSMIEMSDKATESAPNVATVAENQALSSLFSAASCGDITLLQRILEEYPRIKIDTKDSCLPVSYFPDAIARGRTALHIAAEAGEYLAVSWLVDVAGASLSSIDLVGETALSLAIENQHIDCVKFLLDRDASLQNVSLPMLGGLPVGRAFIDNLFRAYLAGKQSFLSTMDIFLAFLQVTIQSRTALNHYVLKLVELDLSLPKDSILLKNKDIDSDTNIDEMTTDPTENNRKGIELRTPFLHVLLHPTNWVCVLPALLRWQSTLQYLSKTSVSKSEAADLGDDLVRRIDDVIAALFASECLEHEAVLLQQLLLLPSSLLPSSLRLKDYKSKKKTKDIQRHQDYRYNQQLHFDWRKIAKEGQLATPGTSVNNNSSSLPETEVHIMHSRHVSFPTISLDRHYHSSKASTMNNSDNNNMNNNRNSSNNSNKNPEVDESSIRSKLSLAPVMTNKKSSLHSPSMSLLRGDLAWLQRPPALFSACLADGSILHYALTHNLKALFAVTQVCSLLDKSFHGNARLSLDNKDNSVKQFRNDFRWLLTLRFCPRNFLLLEFCSQIVILALIWQVSVTYGHLCRDDYYSTCDKVEHWTAYEVALSLFVFSELCYEVGLMLSGHEKHLLQAPSWSQALQSRFKDDVWNLVDAVSVLGGVAWVFFRAGSSTNAFAAARVILSLLAVPQSLGMLRYFSLFKTLGELVVIIRAMTKDLLAFLIVYLVFILGFGIAFRGLFFTSPAYDSTSNTFLTLFSDTMMSYDFSVFDSDSSFINGLGVVLTVICVTGTSILLLNLLIAQMWETYERIRNRSRSEWTFQYAQLVQRLCLWREKNVFCILPAPLNLIPIVFTLGGLITIVRMDTGDIHNAKGSNNIYSIDSSYYGTATTISTDNTNHSPLNKHYNESNESPTTNNTSYNQKQQCFVSVGGTITNCVLAWLYYPFFLLRHTILVLNFAPVHNSPINRKHYPYNKRKSHHSSNLNNMHKNHNKNKHIYRHNTKNVDVHDEYERYSSHDKTGVSHTGSNNVENEAGNEGHRYITLKYDWLEQFIFPLTYYTDDNNNINILDKLRFCCISLPLLLCMWPVAPMVAAQLGRYPLLEILDSKEAVFLPSEYLKAATSWMINTTETLGNNYPLSDTAENSQSGYFTLDDSERIILPLVREEGENELDILTKKNISRASKNNYNRLENHVSSLESTIQELKQSQEKQFLVFQQFLASSQINK